MSRSRLLTPILCTLLVAGACAVQAAPSLKQTFQPKTTIANRAIASTTMTSTDGTVQLSLPQPWKDARKPTTKQHVKIKVADRSRALHLIVTSHKRLPNLTLEQLAEVGMMGTKAAMKTPQVQRTQLASVNGHTAIQYQIAGRMMDVVDMVMLVTTVETPTTYHVIVAGSPTATFGSNKAELLQIIQSFREVKTTAAIK